MKAILIKSNSVAVKYFLKPQTALDFLRRMSSTGKVYNSVSEIEELYIPEDRSVKYWTDNDTSPNIIDLIGKRTPQREWEISYINITE